MLLLFVVDRVVFYFVNEDCFYLVGEECSEVSVDFGILFVGVFDYDEFLLWKSVE